LTFVCIAEEGEAQFRRIDSPLRQMTEMVMKWMGKLTWKSWCENAVRSPTLESRPTISCVREMNMEEGKSGDPGHQPP
jgi:hypothetical protein